MYCFISFMNMEIVFKLHLMFMVVIAVEGLVLQRRHSQRHAKLLAYTIGRRAPLKSRQENQASKNRFTSGTQRDSQESSSYPIKYRNFFLLTKYTAPINQEGTRTETRYVYMGSFNKIHTKQKQHSSNSAILSYWG